MHDVVMTLRSKPFGEWVVAYYDPAKTTTETLLKRLHQKGCREATQEKAAAAESGGIRVSVANPLVAPGDWVQVEVRPPEGKAGTAALQAPAEWTVLDGARRELKQASLRCDVQTPGKAKAGRYDLTVQVTLDGAAAQELKVQVELVTLVKG
jgi:hypothetical protein